MVKVVFAYWIAVVLASIGGGCGGGGAPADMWTDPGADFRDGSRLIARTFSYPGSPALFVGIFDRARGVECEFGVATDNKLRCLPADGVGPVDPTTVEPADQWQEGVEAAGAGTGRVLRNEIHATDGGIFPNRISGDFIDAGFGQPCNPDVVSPPGDRGDGVCLPGSAFAGDNFFSGAGCSVELASAAANPMPFVV
jgi:hypothetical protein